MERHQGGNEEIQRFVQEMDPYEQALSVTAMSQFLDRVRDRCGGHLTVPYFLMEKEGGVKEYDRQGEVLKVACDVFNVRYKVLDPTHCVKMHVVDGVVLWRKEYETVYLCICGDLDCSC